MAFGSRALLSGQQCVRNESEVKRVGGKVRGGGGEEQQQQQQNRDAATLPLSSSRPGMC